MLGSGKRDREFSEYVLNRRSRLVGTAYRAGPRIVSHAFPIEGIRPANAVRLGHLA